MHKELLKKALTIAMLFAFALFLTGCKQQNEKSEPITIGLSFFPTTMFWSLAEENGYFEEEGVVVDIKFYDSITGYMEEVENKNLDIVGLPLMDVYREWDQGREFKIVAAIDYSYGADAIITRKGKGLDNLKSLKNQKVGVEIGTIGEFLLDYALVNRANLDIEDVEKINYGVSETVKAFTDKEIDAIVAFEPYVHEALKNGDGQIIFDSSNERGLILDVWIVNKDNLETDKENYIKVFKAWFKAIDYYKNNEDEAIKIISKRFGMTPEEYAIQLEGIYIMDLRDNITSFSIGSGFDSIYGAGNLIEDFYKSKELLTNIPEINEMLDDSIVKTISRQNL